MPAPPQGAQPQQAAFGQSSATQPTPNRGYEAAGAQKVGLVVKMLGDTLQMVGVGSELGKAILDCMQKLSKFVPPGAVTPAGEQTQLQNMQAKNMANNQQMQQIRAQQAQPQPGAPA